MAVVFVLLLVFCGAVSRVSASMGVLPDEEVKDCTVGGRARYVDFTGLVHEQHNDTYFTVEGELIKSSMIKFRWKN